MFAGVGKGGREREGGNCRVEGYIAIEVAVGEKLECVRVRRRPESLKGNRGGKKRSTKWPRRVCMCVGKRGEGAN